MKKFWVISAGLVALSGGVFADTIGSGSTGSLTSVPTTTTFLGSQVTYVNATTPANPNNTQTPFWNNPSGDNINGHVANVGDILAGLSGQGNVIGGNLSGGNISGSYYAGSTGNGDPVTSTNSTFSGALTVNSVAQGSYLADTPALEFSFQSQATAYNIALLFADSQNDSGCASGSGCAITNGVGTTFGYYTETNNNTGNFTFTPLSSPVNTTTGGPTTIATNDVLEPNSFFYGFYATVCYQTNASGVCTSSVTYTTGAGNWSTNTGSAYNGGLGWNHFALFELANGQQVLGFEDSPWIPAANDPNSVEGIGDFNDIVIGMSAVGAVPEPGTIAIMGLGLAGLGILGRRRFGKK